MARAWFKGDLDSLHEAAESGYTKDKVKAWAVYLTALAEAENNKGK